MMAPSEVAMRSFLVQGKWKDNPDDNISGELMDPEFLKGLVQAYQASPTDETAIANLGLIALGIATAQWGVAPVSMLPTDPAERDWKGPTSVFSGKHLMSYATGGLGVMHQDSAGLERFFDYLGQRHPDVVPPPFKATFFGLKGINFDHLCANGGLCAQPSTVARKDLDGIDFKHTAWDHADADYCTKHYDGATSPEDWRVFRHGMRQALRQEDVQFRLISDFISESWASAYKLVVQEAGHDVREAFIIARIWNSGPAHARTAFQLAAGKTKLEDRVQVELEHYADVSAHNRSRWGLMRRAIAVYDTFGTTT